MSFQDLRRAVQGEIFDYPVLIYHLREYHKPRDKVTQLLKNQSIVRIKKGLYIFGPEYQRAPISLEILANLVYSPSYVSLEYALSKYGLIPERAYQLTSVCLNRSRVFHTPKGMFSYEKRPLAAYPIGVERIEIPNGGGYLIASPEKALIDLVFHAGKFENVHEMKEYLYDNMRMEPSELKKLNRRMLREIINAYQMPDILMRAIYD